MDRETEISLENLVRVGTVTWIDPGKRVARVKFRDTGFPSAVLPVLAHRLSVTGMGGTAPQVQAAEGLLGSVPVPTEEWSR